ncbi:hypothetical protein ACWDTI_16615 [Gordonia sp. NPDC003424]
MTKFGAVGDGKVSVGSIASGSAVLANGGSTNVDLAVGDAVVVPYAGAPLITGAPVASASTTALVNALPVGTYGVIVTAFCGAGESAGSARATVTLSAVGSITVTWTMANQTNVAGYHIYAGLSGYESYVGSVFGAATTSFTWTGGPSKFLASTVNLPPTVPSCSAPLRTTVASFTNKASWTLANAAGTAIPASRSVTDAACGRSVTDAAATVNTTTVTSATAAFTQADVGSYVSISGGALTGKGVTPIIAVISATQVTVGMTINATVSGAIMHILPNVITSATANFAAGDVGKTISVSGQSPLFGSFVIWKVLSATKVLINGYPAASFTGASATIPAGKIYWGTDNTTALSAVRDVVSAQITASSGVKAVINGYAQNLHLHFPAGRYLISGDSPVMPDPATGSRGFKMTGAGRDNTFIYYAGASTPGAAFMRNNNKYMYLDVEDMSFFGLDDSADWLQSMSNSLAQNYIHEKINYYGTWRRIYSIYGGDTANTNSEWSLARITYSCTVAQAIFDCGVGTLEGGTTISDEDQFLNYHWEDCTWQFNGGDGIRMAMGGCVTLDGFVNHFYSAARAGTFISLLGASHADGVARLSVRGLRQEAQHTYAHRVLYSEWGTGSVTFDDTTLSGAGNGMANTVPLIELNMTTLDGATYTFSNSSLVGTLVAWWGTSYSYRRLLKFDGCTFRTVEQPHQYVTSKIAPSYAGGNVGSQIPVIFNKSRGYALGSGLQNAALESFTYRADVAANSTPQRRTMYVQGNPGGIPGPGATSTTFRVPPGSIITRITLIHPANASTSTGWTVAVQTTEGTPRVLCSAGGAGSASLGAGYRAWADELQGLSATSGQASTLILPLYVGTNSALSTLTLVTNASYDNFSSASFCIVDFVA